MNIKIHIHYKMPLSFWELMKLQVIKDITSENIKACKFIFKKIETLL